MCIGCHYIFKVDMIPLTFAGLLVEFLWRLKSLQLLRVRETLARFTRSVART